ncbi:predicted protein [Naegleria gruberi]|uniref:Predicted protein n=1 Tax=Naegleria gruberi TaxID=5762 RepID=D2VQS6_NAEGR|nr:uncharacterized protein NAEGRDRAFT_71331 [Naegleria gruberi]EFC40758.1 predicted protein [Naegleria gruberi]|eukprot:XP_002673502.1 predicted protein [Naegleria gruberi strain NEG-M]
MHPQQLAVYSAVGTASALFTWLGARLFMQKLEFPGVNFKILLANLLIKTAFKSLGSKLSVLDVKVSPIHRVIESDLLRIETIPLSFDANSSELYLKESSELSEYIIRVYQPKQYREEGYPILMYIHGGGWMFGSIDTSDDFCRHVSNNNYLVISVDYRKTPQHVFPACLNDCLNALCWIGKNFKKYNGNINQLTICGDSAGGHLSIHTQIRIFSLEKNIIESENIPKITHQALIYPATEIYENSDSKYQSLTKYRDSGLIINAPMVDMFWKQLIGVNTSIENAKLNPFLSIMSAIDPTSNSQFYSQFPKGFIWLAEYDVLRDEGQLFGDVINKSTNEKRIEIREWKQQVHGFLSFRKEITFSEFVNQLNSLTQG